MYAGKGLGDLLNAKRMRALSSPKGEVLASPAWTPAHLPTLPPIMGGGGGGTSCSFLLASYARTFLAPTSSAVLLRRRRRLQQQQQAEAADSFPLTAALARLNKAAASFTKGIHCRSLSLSWLWPLPLTAVHTLDHGKTFCPGMPSL